MMNIKCRADVCIHPINCTRREECLSVKKETPMACKHCNKFPCECTNMNAIEEPIHHFESGASSSGNKPPYECLTLTLLRRAALRMEKGLHYGKHNWKKGAKDKQFILDRLNHAIEHLVKAAYEIDNDIPMTDDDLAAVVVNAMFAMEYQENNTNPIS